MPEPDRSRALAKLTALKVPVLDVNSLHAVSGGNLFYACESAPRTVAHGKAGESSSARAASMAADTASGANSPAPAAEAVAPVLISSPPIRHSRPGASKVIYLDFNGQNISGTDWNVFTGKSVHYCRPYSTDSDETTFNAAEQANIIEIWERVAEDYRPFDVDVTTEEPSAMTNQVVRALVTKSTGTDGVYNPVANTSSGVAFVNVFGDADFATASNPAFIYYDGANPATIADIVSHEVGHTMGLSHDGTSTLEYYQGSGEGELSWGPIMGAPLDRNFTQWSNGGYNNANNQQDDVGIIAGKLGYMPADHAVLLSDATPLTGTDATTLTATGVISQNGERDSFKFTTTYPSVSVRLDPYRRPGTYSGGDLNAVVQLLDERGYMLAQSGRSGVVAATVFATLAPGTYYINVVNAAPGIASVSPYDGYPAYGCLGSYTLSVKLRAAVSPARTVAKIGDALVLTAVTGSPAPLQYQWRKNGQVIPGATPATCNLGALQQKDAGAYSVDITDGTGAVTHATGFVLIPPVVSAVRTWPTDNTPASLTDAIAVAGSSYHALALRTGGTVVEWAGQTRTDYSNTLGTLSDVVAVSDGVSFAMALRANGTVAVWGVNDFHQYDVPAGLTDAIAVAAGLTHCLALRSDGTVVAWGDNTNGAATVPAGLGNVVAIAAGQRLSLALKADGTVVAWGDNTDGQATVPAGLAHVTAISAGWTHAMALKSDGTVADWGKLNSGGQDPIVVPAGLSDVVAISAGGTFGLAARADGSVVGWGNANGSVALPPPADLANVVALGNGVALRDITMGALPVISQQPQSVTVTEATAANFTVVATSSHSKVTYQWRKNGIAIPGATQSTLTFASVIPTDAAGYDVVVSGDAGAVTSAAAVLSILTFPTIGNHSNVRQVLQPGQPLALSVTATGTGSLTYQWFHNRQKIPGATSASYNVPSTTRADAGAYYVQITDQRGMRWSMVMHVLVAPAVTEIVAWGRAQPAVPTNLSDVVSVSSDGSQNLALKADGRVVAWSGALGDQVTGVVQALADVVQISATGSIGGALQADGSLTIWRGGDYPLVRSLSGPSDIVSFSAYGQTVLALTARGKVLGWNLGSYTQFDYGMIPPDQPDLVQLLVSSYAALGLRTDGTMVVWIGNDFGQGAIPAGLSGVLALGTAQDGMISLALKSDGTVAQWGYRPRLNPTIFDQPVGGVSNVAALTRGLVALRRDGTVVRWGNDTTYAAALTPPADLADVIAVEAGLANVIALRDATQDPLPTIVTQPVAGTVKENTPVTLAATVEAGHSHPAYQWYKDDTPLAGATGPTLALGKVTAANTGSYTLRVTNSKGTVVTAVTRLVVEAIPAISGQSPSRQVIAAGRPLTLGVTATGTGSLQYQWYHDGRALTGATTTAYSVPEATTSDSGIYYVVVSDQIGARRSRLMAVRVDPTDTQVVAWGANESGQTTVPADLAHVVSVVATGSCALALTAENQIRAWGYNADPSSVVDSLGEVFAIAPGGSYSIALKMDGTVALWGQFNGSWQVALPASLTDVVAISATGGNFLGLRADGTVVVVGNYSVSDHEVTLSDLDNAIAIGTSSLNSVALTTGGVVRTWGYDNSIPFLTQPDGITDFVGLAIGEFYAVGLRADGSVLTWGNPFSSSYKALMAVPADLGSVVRVSAGSMHALALKSDGTVAGWGINDNGQITIPAGLKRVYQISAGGYFSLALCDVSVPKAPTFTLAPTDQTIWAGQSVTLRAQASGSPAPAYQWQKNGVPLPGATGLTLTLSAAQTSDSGAYSLVATNKLGRATSAAATVTIRPPGARGTYFGTFASGGLWALEVRADNTATYIAHLPSRQSAIVVNLTVNADGSFSVPGVEIKSDPGSAVRSLELGAPEAPVTRAAAAASYTLTGQIGATGAVTGQLSSFGETFTGAADATTGAALSSSGYYTASALGTATGTTYVIVGPTGQAFAITTGASLGSASGVLSGTGQLTAYTTANAALSLTIDAVARTVAASVTPAGSSTPVTYAGLASTVASTARVVNLSVRTPAGTGSQTLIIGFVVGGGGTKNLLLRGIGPALGPLGVSAPLADPSMRLLDAGGAELAASNDWGGGATLSRQFAAVGASSLPPDSKEAALSRTLTPGAYSFHTFPAGAGTGVVLGEAYDADDGTSAAAVMNMSARTQVGTGENILIAGFVITGNAPKTILIRGLGPTLIGLGVAGALADPQLYLYGSTGQQIAGNDNWGGTTTLKSAFTTVGAGSLSADTSKDAALLVTLMPGAYTAQVSGVGGTSGVGLVEIYLMP